MNQSTPDLPVHHQFPEFIQTHVHWVSDVIQPSHPLSSPSPPAPNPSQHQSLSNESTVRMKWPKYWSFSFSIIPSKEIPGLISFRMDWFCFSKCLNTIPIQNVFVKAKDAEHISSNNQLSITLFITCYYTRLPLNFHVYQLIFFFLISMLRCAHSIMSNSLQSYGL